MSESIRCRVSFTNKEFQYILGRKIFIRIDGGVEEEVFLNCMEDPNNVSITGSTGLEYIIYKIGEELLSDS